MYGDDGRRKEDERNILDDTCQGVNVTEVFLNADPEMKLSLQGQITILFKIAPHYLYLDQIAMWVTIWLELTSCDSLSDLIFRIRHLRNRFDEYGYNALQFILVISYLGEEKLQKKFESEIKLLMMDDTLDVIKETEDSKPIFGMTDNQAYVLDPCGRLTYIIVPPWSHCQYPYVKAAILSTIYDFPCGHCDKEYIMQPYPGYDTYAGTDILPEIDSENRYTDTSMEHATESEEYVRSNETFTENNFDNNDTTTEMLPEETTTPETPTMINATDDVIEHELDYDWNEPLSENVFPNFNESSLEEFVFNETMIEETENNDNDNYSIPLRIILPVEHLHYSSADKTYSKYNYIILNTKDQSFHGHLESDTPSEMENVLNDKESNAQELLNGLDEQVKELYIGQTGQIYQLLKEYFVKGQSDSDSFKEVSLLDTDIIRDQPKITNMNKVTDIRRHYEYLVQWLTWQFES